jgi:signal transduction histidine kinase
LATARKINLSDLSLASKGIMLVAVPLFFELIFIGCLVALYMTAEQESKALARSRDFLSAVNEIPVLTSNAGQALVAYKYTRSPMFIKRYAQIAGSLKECRAHMDSCAQGDERREQHARKIDSLMRELFLLLDTRGKLDAADTLPIKGNDFRKQLESVFEPLMQETQQISEEERSLQQQSPLSEHTLKQALLYLLIAGAGASIFISVSLARFFSKSVIVRLSVLSDNARRLASRTKLNEPLPGKDEIAELDSVFHAVTDELRRAEERKQQFVSMIGHDLRTPLSALQVTLALIAKGSYGTLSERGQTRATNAGNSLNRLIKLINDLLDLERLEAGAFTFSLAKLNAATLIEYSNNSVEQLAEKQGVKLLSEALDLEFEGDFDRLAQVLINLISNAIKFSPLNGKVVVRSVDLTDHVRFEIVDNGPGIPPSEREKIFSRFYQLDSDDAHQLGGSGLGLAISKALIELHEGVVGVRDCQNGGSIFWFQVPKIQRKSKR